MKLLFITRRVYTYRPTDGGQTVRVLCVYRPQSVHLRCTVSSAPLLLEKLRFMIKNRMKGVSMFSIRWSGWSM
jgi:hypothetical protein